MTQPRDRRSSLLPFLGSLGFVLIAIIVVILARPQTKDGPNGLLKPFSRTLPADGILRDTRVRLEQSYVNDVCLTPRFNQCVFYEEELSKD